MSLRSRRSHRVLFDGWYGYRNAGDDAFCAVASHIAATEWGIDEPWIANRGGCLPRTTVRIRDVVPHPPRFRGHVRSAVLTASARARTVIHAGGSTFMRPQPSFTDQMKLRKLGLVNVHLASVSVGPFDNMQQARRLARLMKNVDSISVRDEASRDRLLDLDADARVSVAFDLAVLLPAFAQVRSQASQRSYGRPVIGVSLCSSEARDPEGDRGRIERIVEFTRTLVRRTGGCVRLLEFCDHPVHGDRSALGLAAAALRDETSIEYVEYSPDPLQVMAAVSGTDFVIAMRLHAAIFAFAVGVQCLIVPYAQKGREVGRMFCQEEFITAGTGPDSSHTSLAERVLGSPGSSSFCLSLEEAQARARRAFPDPSTM